VNTWRLIPLISASGAFHMAVDEWLLEQHRHGHQPSVLRFYQWEPAALSLGYHQRQIPDGWRNVKWQGRSLDLVRRPSGGRAVLHQGDLTYAIITSDLPGRRREIYQTLSAFLVEGWRSLGVPLFFGKTGRGYIHNPSCFGTATDADLVTADGYKFIGSAQLYRGKALLQHGSMRLAQDSDLFYKVFGDRQASLAPSIPTSIETIVSTLTQTARLHLGADFVVTPLTADEYRAIAEFQQQKVKAPIVLS